MASKVIQTEGPLLSLGHLFWQKYLKAHHRLNLLLKRIKPEEFIPAFAVSVVLLSESEMDLPISLKKLAIQRAKISSHDELAEKFDRKMLRALGLVLMEYVRKRVKDDTFVGPSVVHQLRLLDNCNLLRTQVNDTIDIEEVLTHICKKNSKKKTLKRRR